MKHFKFYLSFFFALMTGASSGEWALPFRAAEK